MVRQKTPVRWSIFLNALNYYLEDRTRDREGRRELIKEEIMSNRGYAGKETGKLLLKLYRQEKGGENTWYYREPLTT